MFNDLLVRQGPSFDVILSHISAECASPKIRTTVHKSVQVKKLVKPATDDRNFVVDNQ